MTTFIKCPVLALDHSFVKLLSSDYVTCIFPNAETILTSTDKTQLSQFPLGEHKICVMCLDGDGMWKDFKSLVNILFLLLLSLETKQTVKIIYYASSNVSQTLLQQNLFFEYLNISF